MIEVPQAYVKQVEYLIEQSEQGNHVLFEMDVLRQAFTSEAAASFTTEDAYQSEPYIERLLELPTLLDKKIYLKQLDSHVLRKIVRTYFNIVENTLVENKVNRH